MFFNETKNTSTLLFSHGVEDTTAKHLSKPAPLKNLCRVVVRKTMRSLTDSRTIQPLVISLENSGEISKDVGNFLVYDLSGNWREKLVNN